VGWKHDAALVKLEKSCVRRGSSGTNACGRHERQLNKQIGRNDSSARPHLRSSYAAEGEQCRLNPELDVSLELLISNGSERLWIIEVAMNRDVL
jgi:hypothetical protein